MANVGNLIHTPQGLGTIVRVQPGHIDPALSKVVAEPLDQGVPEFLPAAGHGTPLPGQAASAANFIQTLILPSDLDVIAQADVQNQADSQAQAQIQTVADSMGTETTSTETTAAGTEQVPSPPASAPADATGPSAPAGGDAATQQSFVQAVQAYNTVQQRLDTGSGSPVMIG